MSHNNKCINFLYNTLTGKCILKIIVKPWFTKISGVLLNSRISNLYINTFIKKNNIDMFQFKKKRYRSFNDFFTRKIKYSARKLNYEPHNLISPCDAKLLVNKIDKHSQFYVKGVQYTVSSLLRNQKLAEKYMGGYCLIFRLTPDDYHRYCYIDNGYKSRNVKINGVFHTVQPVAIESKAVFKENCREYTLMRTCNFGDVVQIEVGAMLVGKINNFHGKCKIIRGHEKGMFEFGGSTIILLFKDNTVEIDEHIIENSSMNIETKVLYGEVIGQKIAK